MKAVPLRHLMLCTLYLVCSHAANAGTPPEADECEENAQFDRGNRGVDFYHIDVDAAIRSCDLPVNRHGGPDSALLARAFVRKGAIKEGMQVLAYDLDKSPLSKQLFAVYLENGLLTSETLTAEQLYQDAEQEGEVESMVRLGWLTEKSPGNRHTTAAAAYLHYKKAAATHEAIGEAALGLAEERGLSGRVNLLEAIKWYTRAAQQGDRWSQIRLAAMSSAHSVDPTALPLDATLRQFIDRYQPRHDDARDVLSECGAYEVDLGKLLARIRANSSLAPSSRDALLRATTQLANGSAPVDTVIRLYQNVAGGDPYASVHLYDLYLSLSLTTAAIDVLKAMQRSNPQIADMWQSQPNDTYALYYQATTGHICQLANLAHRIPDVLQLYDGGARFLWKVAFCLSGDAARQEKDPSILKKWIQMAVGPQDPTAINYMAVQILHEDLTFPRDYDRVRQAMDYFKAAALMGDVQAQFNYGISLTRHDNPERSEYDEFRWAYLTHAQHFMRGTMWLAQFYEESNPTLAIRYYRDAAERKNTAALAPLSELLLNSPHERAEGFYWAVANALNKTKNEEREAILKNAIEKLTPREIQMHAADKNIIAGISRPYYDRMRRKAFRLTRADSIDDNIVVLGQLTQIAAYQLRNEDAAGFAMQEAELKALRFDINLREISPYFRVLGRSCVYGNLSQLLHELGASDAALYYAVRSVNLLQDARSYLADLPLEVRECFLKVHEERYRWLADLFVEQGRLPEAEIVLSLLDDFKNTEFVRGPGHGVATRLNESAATSEFRRKQESSTTNTLQWAARRAKIEARWQADPASVDPAERKNINLGYEQALQNFKDETAALSVALFALPKKDQHLDMLNDPRLALSRTLERRLADSHAAALLTFVLPARTTILLVTAQGRDSHRWDISSADLQALISRFRIAIQAGDSTSSVAGSELYKNIILPFEQELRVNHISSLLLKLDRSLGYIPVAALTNESGHYLVENYALSLLSSEAADPAGDPKAYLGAAFGVSDPAPGFDPLPAVESELRYVIREVDTEPGAVKGARFLNDQVTPSALHEQLEHGVNVVHIASHFVVGESEADSYLVMGGQQHISLEELSGKFNFENVRILVLSACNSAIATTGDEDARWESAARRLNEVGRTHAVVGSLWPVADTSTAVFMKYFYQGMTQAGGMDNSMALATAQRRFLSSSKDPSLKNLSEADLARWRQPRYWAPFVLSGSEK